MHATRNSATELPIGIGASPKRLGISRLSHRSQEVIWGYLFLAPTIIGLIVFVFGPALVSIMLAFVSTNFITEFRFVGVQNFVELFKDDAFWISTGNTVYYVVGHMVPTVALGLFFASMLNQQIRGRAFWRTLFFIPVVCPIVSTSLIWSWLYETQFGVFNFLLRSAGLPPIHWLTDSSWAMRSIIIWSIWAGLGYPIVLFLAALQGVSRDLIEASKLDGAGPWQTFRHITFPAISPATFFVVVLLVVGSFQVFTQTFVMTNGGPGYATHTIVMYLYKMGWTSFRYGYASAVAVVLFVILSAVTFIQFRIQRHWVHYEHN
jgi:multiple sugar transport system permease protein